MEAYKQEIAWQILSPEEKRRQLFLKQKATLDAFLERGAITQAQYDKSYVIWQENGI
jgi:hypothetical protein